MTNLRNLSAVLCLAGSLSLAACGPGVGGTGAAPIPSAVANAAANAAASAIVDLVLSSVAGDFYGVWAGNNEEVTICPSTIQLKPTDHSFTPSRAWTVSGSTSLDVAGIWRTGIANAIAGSTDQPATLSASRVVISDKTYLRLVVRDQATGTPLWQIDLSAAAAPPGACPA